MKDDRLEAVVDALTSALVSVGILPDVDERSWPRPGNDGGGDDDGAFCLVPADDTHAAVA